MNIKEEFGLLNYTRIKELEPSKNFSPRVLSIGTVYDKDGYNHEGRTFANKFLWSDNKREVKIG
jgi:hypothetical protein